MNESEYHRAVVRLNKPWSRRIQNGSAFRMGLTWGAGFVLAMACGFLLLWGVSVSDDFSSLTSGGAWVLAGGMLLLFWAMMGAIFVSAVKTDQAAFAKLRADVDAYEEREARRQALSTADDNWEPDKSTRQLQHEWYGDGNSDLNWRDREIAEALGIENGDSYKRNFLGG